MDSTQGCLKRICHVVCLWLMFAAAVAAQSGPLKYSLSFADRPPSHLLGVSVDVNCNGAQSIDVAMPAWRPGSYSIENYWHNVQQFSAVNESGRRLEFEKTDKQTWRVYTKQSSRVTISYKLYYPDYDDEDCYLLGPQTFMYVVGNRPYPLQGPVSVKIEAAPANWTVESAMEKGAEGLSFQAPDYDTFVDASIVAGSNLHVKHFEYENVPYHLVFIGQGDFDQDKITRDVKTVVSYLVDMMGGAPFKQYVFFFRANTRGRMGGVEHLNSTDIGIPAYEMMAPATYSRFLFVTAHEFFHLWNVKRIRPSILGPFDYTREQNTRNLYVSEGMTSYWAAIGLRRSGLWSRQDYFIDLAHELKELQTSPGRLMMSAELSSWDTWARSDGAANNSIDYYNKGELLGDLLDLEIRYRTKNKKSLDDVFLYLLKNHGLPKPGFEEKRGFRDAVELITREGAPDNAYFGDFFARYVSGVDEIPWNQFLDHAGLELEEKKGPAAPYIGITAGTSFATNFHGAPPSSTPLTAGQLGITYEAPDSPAEKAGLATGDILVAFDGERITPATYNRMFETKAVGSTAVFQVLRGDRLLTIPVVIGQSEPIEYSIKEKANPTDLQREILASWLSERKP
jgi:predicted metalloprotease with PDZ domain